MAKRPLHLKKQEKTKAVVDQKSYAQVFEQLKADIQQTQLKAALSVTKELTMLYWRTGKMLSEKIIKEGWGAKTIDHLSQDIKSTFPDVSGFSVRNLKYMRTFADCYESSIWAATAAQIPWGHNMLLLDRVSDDKERLWYVQKTIEDGWSRNMLDHWIDVRLYKRQGKAINNFKETLPSVQSDLAEQVLKDPYNLSFLTLEDKYREKELEEGLVDQVQQFLIELGQGFAFMGRQYRLEVEDEDYYLDLLFYHTKLRCHIVIELKAQAFDPKDAGQMNFYLSAVDDLLRHKDDQPTIGLILCKTKKKLKAEYALRDIKKPIGIASIETRLVESLPKKLQASLPTVEEIEEELERKQKLKKGISA